MKGRSPENAVLGPLLLLAAPALAYETDNLTDRHLPLEDATVPLDDHVNQLIAQAIAATNERTSCDADPEKVRRTFAKELKRKTAVDELVPEYKGVRQFGYDRYSAWIAKGGAPHRMFLDRRDIFGDITAGESPILKWAGVGATVRIGEFLVGVDKLDHFFEEGYNSWKKADYGDDPRRGVEWATKTERTIYGLDTSLTFSFGDLRADYDGMRFYDTLLDPVSGVAVVGDDGCVVATKPFTWADHVTWEYDEVLNPPVYTAIAQGAVTRHLERHRDAYCDSWAVWGGPDYLAHLGRAFDSDPEYVAGEAPPRTDPYRLDDLCREPDTGTASEDDTAAP